MSYIAIWGIAAVVSGLAGALLAAIKNRNWSVWSAWCFLLPPALIVLLLLPRHKGPRPRQPTSDEIDEMENAERP
jgi:hypothetical protein